MKKLITLIFLLSSVLASAQLSGTYDAKMKYADTWHRATLDTTVDHLKVGDSTWSYTMYKEAVRPLKYDVYLHLDSTGGVKNTTTVYFKAKKWNEQSAWTTLKTQRYTLGGDTTIVFTESSTAQQYNYFKVDIVGDNDTFNLGITDLYIKFWE